MGNGNQAGVKDSADAGGDGRWRPSLGHDPEPGPNWREPGPVEPAALVHIRIDTLPPPSPWLPALRWLAWIGLLLGATPLLLYWLAIGSGPFSWFNVMVLASAGMALMALLPCLLLTLPLLLASLLARLGRLGRRPHPLWLLIDLLPVTAAAATLLLMLKVAEGWSNSLRHARF